MEPPAPRPARPGDVPAVAALVAAASGHHVARIGMPPLPMVDDDPARVATGPLRLLDGDGDAAVGAGAVTYRPGTEPPPGARAFLQA